MYTWPLPIGAFQDQSKQKMINIYSKKHNKIKNPNWREADQLVIYNTSVAEKLNSGLGTESNIS